jgi:hypothetical protein
MAPVLAKMDRSLDMMAPEVEGKTAIETNSGLEENAARNPWRPKRSEILHCLTPTAVGGV